MLPDHHSPLYPMVFTPIQLQTLAARSSTLWERWEHHFDVLKPPAPGVIKRWQAALGDDFEKRLAWDGLQFETAAAYLGDVEFSGELSSWLDLLNELLELPPGSSQPSEPIPFQGIFAPWVDYARGSLQPDAALLSEEAWRGLQDQLFQKLFSLYFKPLYSDFNVFRQANAGQADIYARYVADMQAGAFEGFLRRYPVLARLLTTMLQFWIEACREFLGRLNHDFESLKDTFGHFEAITEVQTGLSDPHHQRRTVFALTTDSGQKIIYKPKPISIEAAYYDFLAWLNERGLPLPFKVFTALDQGDYGWVAFVEALPCQDAAEAERFYQRAGMLLAILKLLHGTDFHAENLIAHGEHPVIIDMEGLLSPRVRRAADSELGGFGAENHPHSLIDTGFLPYWNLVAGMQKQYDLSALGHMPPEEIPGLVWKDTNTDSMVIELVPMPRKPFANTPILAGESLSPYNYLAEIEAGFREMYLFLLEHRAELPLDLFKDHKLRFIARPTAIYSRLYGQLLEPENLVNGIAHSLVLERMARAFLLFNHKPALWELLASEQAALSQLDIPFFSITTSQSDLVIAPDNVIPHIFAKSSYTAVCEYAQRMSLLDMEHHAHVLRGALYASVAMNAEDAPTQRDSAPMAVNFAAENLLEKALMIGQTLRDLALTHAGTSTWITFTSTEHRRYQFQPMAESFYDGFSGVVLFLAALEKATGEPFRPMVRSASAAWHDLIQQGDDPVLKRLPIGGGTGLGSIAYALGLAGRLLGEEQLIDDALRTARFITPGRIAEDDLFDILGGSAGAILSLLALHEWTGQDALLGQALDAGAHLLKNQVDGAWASPNAKPYTGFSHGTAGIAYALLKLYAASGEAAFHAAAVQAIGYEQRQFVPGAGNWRDLPGEPPVFRSAWCHGAPGILLGRLGALPILDTEEVRHQIETGIQTTLATAYDGVDHLCCGIMGRLDILLTAGQMLNRPELIASSQAGAAGLAALPEFQLFPNLPRSALNLGFFQGITGIGYGLLRQVTPLPNVLLWDAS
jgi:type 2 lantibiotic biosynthesis protein LanM